MCICTCICIAICYVKVQKVIKRLRAHIEDLGAVIARALAGEECNAELYHEISRLRNVLSHLCYPEGKALTMRQLRHEDLQQHFCVCMCICTCICICICIYMYVYVYVYV